ncbi:hypothetical protein EDD16DRAFT_1552525 [Pisolithus croceorrhizus]|nr:hypothetical protein EDD16DRAFT_1552525 [Pisolithus croceorrhizus]
MRLFTCVIVLVTAVTSVVGQLIELGYPTNGAHHSASRTTNAVLRCSMLDPGHLLDTSQRRFYQNFTVQIDQYMTKGQANLHFIPFLPVGGT